jgi:hypothetical protein
MADLLKAINEFRVESATKTDELTEAVKEAAGRLTTVENRVTSVENAQGELEAKVDAVDLKVDNFEEKASQMVADEVSEQFRDFLEKNTGELEKALVKTAEKVVTEKLGVFVEKKVQESLQKHAPQLPVFSGTQQKHRQKIPMPRPRDNTDKKLQMAFNDLLTAAEVRKQTFVIGVVENLDDNGKRLPPKVTYQEILSRFFFNIRYEASEPTTAASNKLPLVRFVVHPEDVHTCKLIVRDRGREIRSLGWWSAQECPKDLRDMEMNAFRFFGEAKKICPPLKRYFLEAEDGFVKVASVPLLPVFCVPVEKGKWPLLAPILLRMIEDVHAGDWVSRFKDQKSVDPKLYEEWGDVIEAPVPASAGSGAMRRPLVVVDLGTPDTSRPAIPAAQVPNMETADPLAPNHGKKDDGEELMDEEGENGS